MIPQDAKMRRRVISIRRGLLMMKLAIRFFAMTVVCAGLADAPVSSVPVSSLLNHHLSATVNRLSHMLPATVCGPGLPFCAEGPVLR